MSDKYSHTSMVSIGSSEVEVEFDYTVSPFIPEQGPSYASGGQPAEGGELEITEARVRLPLVGDKKTASEKVPDWMLELFQNDDFILDDLREAAE